MAQDRTLTVAEFRIMADGVFALSLATYYYPPDSLRFKRAADYQYHT